MKRKQEPIKWRAEVAIVASAIQAEERYPTPLHLAVRLMHEVWYQRAPSAIWGVLGRGAGGPNYPWHIWATAGADITRPEAEAIAAEVFDATLYGTPYEW